MIFWGKKIARSVHMLPLNISRNGECPKMNRKGVPDLPHLIEVLVARFAPPDQNCPTCPKNATQQRELCVTQSHLNHKIPWLFLPCNWSVGLPMKLVRKKVFVKLVDGYSGGQPVHLSSLHYGFDDLPCILMQPPNVYSCVPRN